MTADMNHGVVRLRAFIRLLKSASQDMSSFGSFTMAFRVSSNPDRDAQVADALAQSLADRGSWGLVVALLRQASHSLLGLSGRVVASDLGAEYHRAVRAVEEAAGTASSIMLASVPGLLTPVTGCMLSPAQLHGRPYQGRTYPAPRLCKMTRGDSRSWQQACFWSRQLLTPSCSHPGTHGCSSEGTNKCLAGPASCS